MSPPSGTMCPMPVSEAALLPPVERRLATELGVAEGRVRAAVALFDEGATVPFVARYRKEATDGLDDTQLRTLAERLVYLRELEERRTAVLGTLETAGVLDDALAVRVHSAETKSRLEDVYLPYKPKRRTKAATAREAGLGPLADALVADPTVIPRSAAAPYVDADRGVPDRDAALDGARAILVERLAEDADLVAELRTRMWRRGRLTAVVREGRGGEEDQAAATFSDYFAFDEPFTRLPSHRILAVLRGEAEGVLSLTLEPLAAAEDESDIAAVYLAPIAVAAGIADRGRAADRWLGDTVRWAWRTRISARLGVDLRVRMREVAEEGAVTVFAGNLRDLLLAAPAGARPTMGLDPGLRTGVKVAVVDGTGKVAATATIYPHVPRTQWDASLATLEELARAHGVELVAIGNGTASRETLTLAQDLVRRAPDAGLTLAMVSEAGASVYSASEEASRELPELDVSLRGAVSIARRLQDPLAELVKIDPKSIGVGQYQHDVAGLALARALDAVVEDCVNAVGVDVNTASAPLLRRVSGISAGLATTIVAHRDLHGPFAARSELHAVPRLGAKAFEQAAGFLRIPAAADPLDRSGVHPESYPVVRRIVESAGADVTTLVGDTALLTRLDAAEFTDERVGLPTVTDIIAELDKPGRDPRPAFTTATFAEGVEQITDLRVGMVLEGVVTNVAAFGAFVDVGVHQDGLVHISAMSDEYVSDPRSVAGPGDVVRVKVVDVDVPRTRIGLTLRLDDETAGAPGSRGGARPGRSRRDGSGGDAADRVAAGGPDQGGPREGRARGGRGRGGRGRPGHAPQEGRPDAARPAGTHPAEARPNAPETDAARADAARTDGADRPTEAGDGVAAPSGGGPAPSGGGPAAAGRGRGPRPGRGGRRGEPRAGGSRGAGSQVAGSQVAGSQGGEPSGEGAPGDASPARTPGSDGEQRRRPGRGAQGRGKPGVQKPGGPDAGEEKSGGQGREQSPRGGKNRDRRPAPSGAMADALRRAGFG